MTCRGFKKSSERRSGIGEDEKQPMMVRLAARWRRFNLVRLVTLKKETIWVKKSFIQKREGLLRVPHEEAEIQCKTYRRGKNLAFSEDTCLENVRVRLKMIPKKVRVGLKRRRDPSKRRLGWRLAWCGSTEKKYANVIVV